jgi:transposase
MKRIDILKVVIWGEIESMSLHPKAIPPVPEETSRVARAAFPKGNIYLQIRDILGSIYVDEDFADLFSVKGQL